MIHLKNKVTILVAVLVCAGIMGAVAFSKKNSSQHDYTAFMVQSQSAVDSEKATAPVAISQSAEQQAAETKADKSVDAVLFQSTDKEGFIGTYTGKQIDNPADNIFTISLDRTPSENERVWLCYELAGVNDYTNIPHSINDQRATGGYLVQLSDKASLQREQVNTAWLKRGENRIIFSLPEDAGFGYKVSKLSIEIESGANIPELVVNTSGISYDNKAYISGFVQIKDSKGLKVVVDGKETVVYNGGFEAITALNTNRLVIVKAILPDGKELSKTIHFAKATSADIEFAFDNTTKQVGKTFKKGVADKLEIETAVLKVDAKSLLPDSKSITVTTLRHIDMAALDMGMSNVTDQYKGYRFLPHGEHFGKGTKVAIKYDRTKIPNGYTEDDIRTYYFDTDTKHWVALERDTIDKTNCMIVSNTTHFTDMINGVIQSPVSPETQGFAPTMMSGVKAADPTSKVQVIAPPTANNRGSVGLSYSFEMPPARNGMQPSLGIQYNSDGGSGWLGEGWDLSTPSITVDTRWGVPRYDDANETETYSFNGSMLVTMDDSGNSSVAHRGDKISRKADRQFYPRNEGGFAKIIRKGTSPANYSWEVTDKSGTKYIYGGEDAVLKGTAQTLKGPKEVIVEWKLRRVEELHGDWIEYTYQSVDEPIRDGLAAKAIYLTEVKAGNSEGYNPHTVVTLESNKQKMKKQNSARFGFLTSSNKLLEKVQIAFEGEVLRSYTFTYGEGAFNVDMLTKVNHLDPQGQIFASHDMDYYNDVKNGDNYMPFKSTAETWKLHDDGLDAGFINPVANIGVPGFSDKASALGGSVTTSTSSSFYAGVGPFNGDLLTKSMTVGGSYNHSNSTTKGLSSLVDINGDGLPDKVYQDGGYVYYRPNISQTSDTDLKYGDAIKIQGISKFSESKSTTNGGGAKVNPGFMGNTAVAGIDKSSSTNKITTYFADVNNDGLVDLVANGTVYFNHIVKNANGDLVPTFTLSSSDTPSPIMGGGVIDDSDTQVDPQEQEELVKNSPMLDAVRVWEAPFSGTVSISGNVQLLAPSGNYDTEEYAKADGVRVAIQVKSTEKWNKPIAKGDNTSYAANVSGISVSKGDRIYFRVQSGSDKMSNGAFDQVKWSPVITYTDKISHINPDGQGTANFKSAEGYVFSSTDQVRLANPVNAKVSGVFTKPVTSDNVTLKVTLSNDEKDDNGNPNPSYQQVIVYTKEFKWNETYSGNLDINIPNTISGSNLKFELLTETNVSFDKVIWKPVVEYALNGMTMKVSASVNYSIYASQLYQGIPFKTSTDGIVSIKPSFAGLNVIPIPTTVNGELLMAVKSTTGLIAKKKVQITNGLVTPASSLDSLKVNPNTTLWVEYYGTDKELLSKLGVPSASVTNGTVANILANEFTTRKNDGFGLMYRGWGQFSYNANEGRYGNPIDESLLKLPESENVEIDPVSYPFTSMALFIDKETLEEKWIGQNPEAYVVGDIISSSRLGDQDVVLTNPLATLGNSGSVSGNCIQGSGAIGINIENKSSSTATMVGAMGVSTSSSDGESKTVTSFADMNGDGYPDIITSNQIQLTNTRGGFDGEVISGISNHRSKSKAKSAGYGGNPVHAYSIISNSSKHNTRDDAKAALENAKNQKMLTGSLEIPWNEDETIETFMDVNGDGLPDKILSNKQVQLNLGYGFSSPVDWNLEKMNGGKATTVNAGLGYDFGGSSIQAGFGLTTITSNTNYNLMDLNSDGLLDKVWKEGNSIKVSFNTGDGFKEAITWIGMSEINKSASTAESLNSAVTTGFVIPIPFTPLKMALNPGMSTSKSMSRILFSVQDVDGDGYPEIVESDEDGSMKVYRSTIARTNKLKSVINPLGGSFTVDYDRSQATYDHPGGKWVMKSVEVNDGIKDDGANMKTVFEYQNGRQERHEREFLGFGKVIAKSIDTEAGNDKVYRKAIQEYDVKNIYTAGNQVRAAVEDADGKKYSETVNEYYSYKVTASADNYSFAPENSFCTDRAVVFTPMKYTKTVVYEGQADGLTANESFYEYHLNGNYGDLKVFTYSDKGSLGNAGTGAFNYKTTIEYTHNKAKHILGLPTLVQVKGLDGKLYRETAASYDMNYANHLTKVSQTLDASGNKAEIDVKYDRYGNITLKTMPANSKGQRMWYKYLYDRDYNMYVERVDDAFGYRSEMEEYDYRFGIPLITRDMNGYTLEQTIDNMGRLVTITGPNEQVLGLPYTIMFEYYSTVTKNTDGSIKAPAYAVTKHYDPQNPGDDLETVTFVDGFGRAVQVKKDGVITETTNGTNPVDKKVMIVSGRAKFDAFGRVKEAFYPVSEALGSKTVFNPVFDNVTPTKTVFDIMDRTVKTTLPDGSESLMTYSKDNSSHTLVTAVTDAMGGKQSTFTNGSGLTVKTEQYSGPDGTITTKFEFDPINQLLKAIDNGGNETVSAYDMAGRRTQVIHPASGVTNFKYDNASNLLSKQTANLEAEGKVITYDYDYSRLLSITYPDHPENNVKYTYGNKNASQNRVGRLMLQEDATGAQEFFYGRLGELTKVRRTVIIPNQAIATYVTQWKYDSWDRLEEMIYPDEEKITYKYNTAGLLESVSGLKAYSYNYVNKLGYDKFEQRIYMKYCNGVETNYTYDPQRRRLSNLSVISGKETRTKIMDNAYAYDKVDNVLSVMNNAPLPTTGMGGQMKHTYNYDGLYRLASATGTYTGTDTKTASYSLEIAYDNLHNIVSKKQYIKQQGIQFNGILKAGYDLAYSYSTEKSHQIADIADASYRTESDTVANDVIKRNQKYQYDANGNLIYINTARKKQDGNEEDKATERKLLWDEENRLEAINTNGFIAGYWYDASGERVIKTSGDDEGIYVNDVFSGGRTETANFTAYVNPYLVVSKGGRYTKHIYIGSQRIVSKLGDLDSYGPDPRRIEYAGSNVDGAKVDYKAKYKQSQQTIKDRYKVFEVPYYGKDNDDYVNGSGFCCDNKPMTKSFDPGKNDNPELYQYYYHSDHLGSSSLITNLDGEVVQHIEYVPFGEVFIEERNNTWNTPYLFNAKELDEETGLYYYGARYYDPRSSVWISTDPMQEKYPNISTYAYTFLNPVKYIDPDGRDGRLTGSGTEADPYVIEAVYFYQNNSLPQDQIDGLNAAVNAYNQEGVKKIKDSDGSNVYVSYNLSAQGVDDVEEARRGTAFETTTISGVDENGNNEYVTRYYGNIVGTESTKPSAYGEANNIRVDFNLTNIAAGIANGMDASKLNKGVSIHEVGHNLGGEHSDGTSVMEQLSTTTTTSQIGNRTTTSHTYPSTSKKFTEKIFRRRDTPKTDPSEGRIWTQR